MPSLARRTHAHLRDQACWALLLLAFVLLLNVADPTPRFVGLPLASDLGPHVPVAPSSHPVDEVYNLPDGVSVRAGASTVLAQIFLAKLGGFTAPDDAPARHRRTVASSPHVLPFADRQGPPLRC